MRSPAFASSSSAARPLHVHRDRPVGEPRLRVDGIFHLVGAALYDAACRVDDAELLHPGEDRLRLDLGHHELAGREVATLLDGGDEVLDDEIIDISEILALPSPAPFERSAAGNVDRPAERDLFVRSEIALVDDQVLLWFAGRSERTLRMRIRSLRGTMLTFGTGGRCV